MFLMQQHNIFFFFFVFIWLTSSRQSNRPGRIVLLSVQPQSKDSAQKHPERSAVGSPAACWRGYHRLPAGLPPQTWQGGKQHPRPGSLPENWHWRWCWLLAEHRHQVSAAGLAASTRNQLWHRNQRLRLQRRRSGRYFSRAWRGRTGESISSMTL